LTRTYDGKCFKIPPSEFLAWSQLTGNDIKPAEYEILAAMDTTFTKEIQSEIIAQIERNKQKGNK